MTLAVNCLNILISMKLKLLLLLFLASFFLSVTAQDIFVPLNHELNTRYEEFLARKDVKLISGIKPYRADELRAYIPYDSLENDLAAHYHPASEKATHGWG